MSRAASPGKRRGARQLAPDRAKHSDSIFEAFDFDHSGTLDLDEFTVLMQKFCKTEIPKANVFDSFEKCGGAGCSQLSKTQFQQWVLLMMGTFDEEQFETAVNDLMALAKEGAKEIKNAAHAKSSEELVEEYREQCRQQNQEIQELQEEKLKLEGNMTELSRMKTTTQEYRDQCSLQNQEILNLQNLMMKQKEELEAIQSDEALQRLQDIVKGYQEDLKGAQEQIMKLQEEASERNAKMERIREACTAFQDELGGCQMEHMMALGKAKALEAELGRSLSPEAEGKIKEESEKLLASVEFRVTMAYKLGTF